MTRERLLIVDDEPDMVENCRRILGRTGYRCVTTTDPREAMSLVESERPDLLLTDLKMPGVDGMKLLRHARQVDPHMPVIILTAFATIESAVEAVREGAFDYLPKPFSMDQLKLAVERAHLVRVHQVVDVLDRAVQAPLVEMAARPAVLEADQVSLRIREVPALVVVHIGAGPGAVEVAQRAVHRVAAAGKPG